MKHHVLFIALVLAPQAADACPPIVELTGDASLVATAAQLLDTRGIRLDGERAGCDAIRAHIGRRDHSIVVSIAAATSRPVERVVRDVETATTVIESFARADLIEPLLVAPSASEVRMATPAASVVEPARAAADPARATVAGPPAAVAPAPPHRGISLFGGFETSIGSDRTRWLGAVVGACVTVGPVCAAARLRQAGVVAGPAPFDSMERGSAELLLGFDIPIAAGRTTLAPGFAAGIAFVRSETLDERVEHVDAGARGDIHITWSVPVGERIAIDLSGALDLKDTRAARDMTFPAEPSVLARFGVGLRYGGL